MHQSKENRIGAFAAARGAPRGPVRLKGDASVRAFYRVFLPAGSAVAMTRDEPIPEEDRVFIEIRDRLAACGVPVPEIYDWDRENGIVLMEDFGDVTLEERLAAAGREERRRLYRLAVDELLKIQILGTAIRGDSVALRRAFDEEKLVEELDYFLLHAVEGHYGAAPSPGEREEIRSGFVELSRRIASLPRVLNHRDYHSRNLMVVGGRLGIVDFQDARMGPCQYDLASLLRDSYSVLDPAFRREMAEYYIDASIGLGMEWRDRAEFMERLDLVALQRNLKACGTFCAMAVIRGNRRYIPCLDPTFAYVRENAPRFPFMDGCMRALARHVPPLRGGGV